jgi:hypothetical protein
LEDTQFSVAEMRAAVEGDPLTDPDLLADPERVVLVVKDGVVVKNLRS